MYVASLIVKKLNESGNHLLFLFASDSNAHNLQGARDARLEPPLSTLPPPLPLALLLSVLMLMMLFFTVLVNALLIVDAHVMFTFSKWDHMTNIV